MAVNVDVLESIRIDEYISQRRSVNVNLNKIEALSPAILYLFLRFFINKIEKRPPSANGIFYSNTLSETSQQNVLPHLLLPPGFLLQRDNRTRLYLRYLPPRLALLSRLWRHRGHCSRVQLLPRVLLEAQPPVQRSTRR